MSTWEVVFSHAPVRILICAIFPTWRFLLSKCFFDTILFPITPQSNWYSRCSRSQPLLFVDLISLLLPFRYNLPISAYSRILGSPSIPLQSFDCCVSSQFSHYLPLDSPMQQPILPSFLHSLLIPPRSFIHLFLHIPLFINLPAIFLPEIYLLIILASHSRS